MPNNIENPNFRLAAVLYADNNYLISSEIIHRKIIESVFLSNENDFLSVDSLLEYIRTNYFLEFSSDELENVIHKHTKECFQTNHLTNGEVVYALQEQYNVELLQTVEKQNLDSVIDDFISNHPKYNNKKTIITKYLYALFNSNKSAFLKTLLEKSTEDFICEETEFTVQEIVIINEFLNWENIIKDKIIFDIVCYALEYCLITSNSNIDLSSIQNKKFYLDTNFILRAIGVDGENLQRRTKAFLSKCQQTNSQFFISKSTVKEITHTINHYLSQLKEYPSRKINPQLFDNFSGISNFHRFYNSWRLKRVNPNLALFKTHIESGYEQIKKEFGMIYDNLEWLDKTNQTIKEKIDEYTSSIHSYKKQERYYSSITSAEHDASNIYLVEIRRKRKNQPLHKTKYFLISSDNCLRRWDAERDAITSIVLLPGQWLTLILKLHGRTSDDFRSFISFLNIKHTKPILRSEKLNIVLSGISEITEDFNQQKYILNKLVEKEFSGILKQSKGEELYGKVQDFSKSVLEEKIKDLELQIQETNVGFQEQIDLLTQSGTENEERLRDYNETVDKLREDKKLLTEEKISLEADKGHMLKERDQLDSELTQKRLEKYIDSKLKKWHRLPNFLILISVLIIGFLLFEFIIPDFRYNFPRKFAQWYNSLDESYTLLKDILLWGHTALFIGGFAQSIVIIYKRYMPYKKKEYIEELKQQFQNQ